MALDNKLRSVTSQWRVLWTRDYSLVHSGPLNGERTGVVPRDIYFGSVSSSYFRVAGKTSLRRMR